MDSRVGKSTCRRSCVPVPFASQLDSAKSAQVSTNSRSDGNTT